MRDITLCARKDLCVRAVCVFSNQSVDAEWRNICLLLGRERHREYVCLHMYSRLNIEKGCALCGVMTPNTPQYGRTTSDTHVSPKTHAILYRLVLSVSKIVP